MATAAAAINRSVRSAARFDHDVDRSAQAAGPRASTPNTNRNFAAAGGGGLRRKSSSGAGTAETKRSFYDTTMAQITMNKDILGVLGWTRRKLSGGGGGGSPENVRRKSTMENLTSFRLDQRVQA
jgi:hypothetical protein